MCFNKNLSFYIGNLINYIAVKYKMKALNFILEHFNMKYLKKCYLMRSNYSIIKSIENLPYKKFGTKFPRFDQKHSYIICQAKNM
jgi:hypothetical protein